MAMAVNGKPYDVAMLFAEAAEVRASAERTLAVAEQWERERFTRELWADPPPRNFPTPGKSPMQHYAERVAEWMRRDTATEAPAMDWQEVDRRVRQVVAVEL